MPPINNNKWYSFKCFQTVCELLFGKAVCFATFVKDFGVTAGMERTKNKDMFVTRVSNVYTVTWVFVKPAEHKVEQALSAVFFSLLQNIRFAKHLHWWGGFGDFGFWRFASYLRRIYAFSFENRGFLSLASSAVTGCPLFWHFPAQTNTRFLDLYFCNPCWLENSVERRSGSVTWCFYTNNLIFIVYFHCRLLYFDEMG